MARNYAALPHDYLNEMAALNDAQFGRLCRALLRYSATGEESELRGVERLVWPRMAAQEQRYQASYEEKIDRYRRAAATRWERHSSEENDALQPDASDEDAMQRNATQCDAMQRNATHTKEETKTKTETKTETETNTPRGVVGARGRAIPPTLEEVEAYVRQRGSPVVAQAFIDHYEARGWMLGKTPMRDWRAACRAAERWEQWGRGAGGKPGSGGGKAPAPDPVGDRHAAARALAKDVAWIGEWAEKRGAGEGER